MKGIPSVLYKLAAVFQQHGFQCLLVGGAMRDLLRGVKVSDYDLATDALPGDVQRIFRRVIPTGIKHGTVTILFQGQQFEVTTFRIDGKYKDSRRPENVTFTPSLAEDLSRRDFTINALAWNLLEHKFIDLFDGKTDLKNRVIRAIGNPGERFAEDALRMLRACRFAAQLNFTVTDDTKQAMLNTSHRIKLISAERIRDELLKILLSANPVYGLELMRECGLLQLILPELMQGWGITQRALHSFDVYYHGLYSCEGAIAGSPEIRTAALLHDIGKSYTLAHNAAGEPTFYMHEQISAELAVKILKRLKFPNSFANKVCHLIKHHMFNYTGDWSDAAVRRFLARLGSENFIDLLELRKADKYGLARQRVDSPLLAELSRRVQTLLTADTALSLEDLQVKGNEIMHHLQLPAGKRIGIILNFLLEAVIEDPELNEKARLMQLAANFYTQRLEIDKD